MIPEFITLELKGQNDIGLTIKLSSLVRNLRSVLLSDRSVYLEHPCSWREVDIFMIYKEILKDSGIKC